MSQIKNALIRYRVIDRCLRNEFAPFPTKEILRRACEEALYGEETGSNICDSTIEKDLFAMRMEHDAPIKYSKREKGYFYEDKNFSIQNSPLNSTDIDAIKMAANTLLQFRETSLFKQFGFAIDKIFDRVHMDENPLSADLEQMVQFETATSAKGSEFLSPLVDAIRHKKLVYFEYESFVSGKRKPRKVYPLLLKEYRNRWYLISHDLVKDSITTYALERMTELTVSDDIFSGQIRFDSKRFFQHAIGITANENLPEHVVFKAENVAAKYIESQPFHPSQKTIKEGKNRTTFSMEVLVSEELVRSLMSFGGEVEVVEPQSLRQTIRDRVLKLATRYEL